MTLETRIEPSRDDRPERRGRRGRNDRRRRSAVSLGPVYTLESRRLLSQTFTVTNPVNDGSTGSLSWAILQVDEDTTDSTSSPDVIDFNIPGTGPFTMAAPGTNAPAGNPVIINGYSQSGSSPNTLTQGDNAVIQIVLTGSGGFGLYLSGGYSTVEGLAINDSDTDVALVNPNAPPFSNPPTPIAPLYGGDTVTGCFIGTDSTGETAVPSGTQGTGVEVDEISNNTIGGTAPADRNIISTGATGVLNYGVWITGVDASNDVVEGNYIGTDATGTKALGNWQDISLYQSGTGNTIGGAQAGAGNIISGSIDAGIIINPGCDGTLVQGNLIGTDVTGTVALPNGTETAGNTGFEIAPGVAIYSVQNTIGGTTAGAGNLISGNDSDGIDVIPGGAVAASSQGTLIEGNVIGTNLAGTQSLPNLNEGIGISGGAGDVTIGGSQAGAGNVISGNTSYGVFLGSGSGNNLLQGNLIGTSSDGTQALPNSEGVEVQCPNNTIGGSQAGAGNVISGNTGEGVFLDQGSGNNLLEGNLIGTNAAGNQALANSVGVQISNNGNTIGGTQAGERNVISGNTNGGIIDYNSGNVIQGNYIGTDVTGSSAVPNGFLSFNAVGGVVLLGDSNTVGGTTPGAGNVISGNGSDGVDIVGVSDNLVEGNFIGTGANGTEALGNGAGGVSAFNGASDNTIGGLAAGAGNVIANNASRPGVNIGASNSDDCPGNAILSNSIFNNAELGINLGFNSAPTQNMPGGPFQGPNDLQNYPVLTEVFTVTGVGTVITGTLNSAPDVTFTLQFFDNATADPSGYGEGQALLGTTSVTTDANGNASFTANFTVSVNAGDAISATATDASGDTSEFAQDFAAVEQDAPLMAVNDSYNTDENTTLNVAAPGVQANDFSVFGPTFTSVLESSPSHGALSFNADGSFKYVPAKNFIGTDSFTYEDELNGSASNVATVTISVNSKTLYVTNTNDSGPGSLRQALTTADASNSPGADTVLFTIPGTGPFVITPDSVLPLVTRPTIINGYSQPGAHTNSLATGDNAIIQIELDGSSSGGANGLVLTGGAITVEGLSIIHFNDGILISGSGANTITGDFLGTNPTGTGQGYGNQTGLEVQTSGNVVGGPKAAARNVISGNNNQGVLLDDGASGNLVAGNYIGTDITGDNRLGNNGGGVVLYDAPQNTIGGGGSGAGNLISGNGNDGVLVSSSDSGPGSLSTVIQGNVIGLNAEGILALGNSNNGVEVDFGSGTLIGGPSAALGNVISDNQAGVYLQNSAIGVAIEGNNIGTDARGFKAIGNQYDGVLLSGAFNTVGGAASGDGNVISGNGRDGISDGINAGSIGFNTIEGNLIGTDSTGTVALANNQDGIELGTLGDIVGGTTAATRNVISGNSQYGLVIERSSTGILVEGNDIGTDKTGKQPLGNGSGGVQIQDNAFNNTIGGTAVKAGNIIAYNGQTGVAVTGSAISNPILTNAIFANRNQGIVLSGSGDGLQVAPVLSSAVDSSSSTSLQGTLTASPNTAYQIQVFANPAADPSGFGQGQTYLAAQTVTTNGSGVASFSFTIKPTLAPGEVVSATATSPSNNTSAFSADMTVTRVAATTTVKSTVVATAVDPAPAVATVVPLLAALPSASSTPDDSVVTALAVDQVHAKKRRAGSGLSYALEHAAKIRTSDPHRLTIRVHARTAATAQAARSGLESRHSRSAKTP
jgi:hypothetical protein